MKICLIDGNSLLYRAFHAYPPFRTTKGELVNAIHGFMSMLMSLLLKERPECLAVAWDRRAKTFRHEQFAEYKGTRKPPPEGLYEQLPRLKTVLETLGIPMFEMDGYEADDILATIATKIKDQEDMQVYIVSSDRDLLQLVGKNISVIASEYGFQKYTIYNEEKVKEKYGIIPEQIIDYKSLVGDASDNIPGVHGIGPQKAQTLLVKYQSLEGIYNHIDEMERSTKQKLTDGKDSAFMSKKLVTLLSDAPIQVDIKNCEMKDMDTQKIKIIFEELEFRSLGKKIGELENVYRQKSAEEDNLALPLSFE